MIITEFLDARITEDEYDANRELLLGTTPTLTRMNARILDECKAKRAIIRDHDEMVEAIEYLSAALPGNLNQDPDTPWRTAPYRHLAAIYSAHPDYRHEWAPDSPSQS